MRTEKEEKDALIPQLQGQLAQQAQVAVQQARSAQEALDTANHRATQLHEELAARNSAGGAIDTMVMAQTFADALKAAGGRSIDNDNRWQDNKETARVLRSKRKRVPSL